jgi:hypothetical protein
MLRYFSLFCFLLLLSGGCSSYSEKSKMVILQDPKTMDFVECEVSGAFITPASYTKNEECVEEYKRQGFVVWGERK